MATACSIVMANNSGVAGGGLGPIGGVGEFRGGHAATSCVLMTVSIVSICTLVVCGVLVVREYSLASTYQPTVCRIGNVSFTGNDVICRHCASGGDKRQEKGPDACVQTQFPCAQIIVTYPGPNGTNDRWALLYQDSVQASGAYSQCSFSTCNRRREENERKVREFADGWRSRIGTSIGCFYDTTNDQRVIVDKTYSQRDVIHSMLWPSVVVIACGLVFLRLKTRRHRLTFCGRRPASTDEIIDLVKKGAAAAAAVGGGGVGRPINTRHHDTAEDGEFYSTGGDGRCAGKHRVDHRDGWGITAVGKKRHSIGTGGNNLDVVGNSLVDRRAILLSSSSLPQLSSTMFVNQDDDSVAAEQDDFGDRCKSSDVPNASDVVDPVVAVSDGGDRIRRADQPLAPRGALLDGFPTMSVSMPMLLNESVLPMNSPNGVPTDALGRQPDVDIVAPEMEKVARGFER